MIRVAMLSFWHVHGKDYAREAEEHPDTEIVAVWDEVPERGQAEAEQRGVPFYDDLDELLSQPEIDGVIVDAPTNMHRDVMVAAARAGKHIFTEKVIAATLSEAQEIIEAVDQAGVTFLVAMRRLPMASTRAVKEIIDQGLLGDVVSVRVRDSHSGVLPSAQHPRGMLDGAFLNREQAQGGVLIDLCHSVYLTRHFLGKPESVTAALGYFTGRDIEDNAVVTLRCSNGAIGVIEAGYVTQFAPFGIEIHGTQGTVLYSETGIGEGMYSRISGAQNWTRNQPPGPEGKLLLRSAKIEGNQWLSQDVTTPAAPKPFDQWVAHIQQGTKATENIALGLDLTAIIEAAYRSAESGQAIRL